MVAYCYLKKPIKYFATIYIALDNQAGIDSLHLLGPFSVNVILLMEHTI